MLKSKKRILIYIFIAVLCYIITGCGQVDVSSKNKETEPASRQKETDMNQEALPDIFNLVLFGTETGEQCESPSITLASISLKQNKIRFISLLADTKVEINGYGEERLSKAYKYGGAELAMETINKSFGLNITKYIAIDRKQLQQIVDLIGGIKIELTEQEARLVNRYAKEYFDEKNEVKKGLQKLNGAQAASYAGLCTQDSDYGQSEHQRTVLNAMVMQIQNMSRLRHALVLTCISEYAEANISTEEIKALDRAVELTELKVESNVVPTFITNPELHKGEDGDGVPTWEYDLLKAKAQIARILG